MSGFFNALILLFLLLKCPANDKINPNERNKKHHFIKPANDLLV